MSPSGAQPTQMGDTERPVPPRVRLDEGSVTPLCAIALLSQSSSPARRLLRRLLGVPERLLDALPQQRLAEALPDGVLDGGVVLVLGRDERRLLRLFEQPPPPLRQRAVRRLGPSVFQGVGARRERPEPGLERLRLARGEEAQQLDGRGPVADRDRYREGVATRVDKAASPSLGVERNVVGPSDGARRGVFVRVEAAGPVRGHRGPALPEAGRYLVVMPVRRLLRRGPL